MQDMARWRHAVHEAGHLLLGLRHGRKAIAVAIDPTGQSLVRLDYPPRLDALTNPAAPIQSGDVDLGTEEILIKWGGHAGESLVFPNVRGDRQDRIEIESIAQRLGITNSDSLRKQAIAELVRERDTVIRLAKALEAETPPALDELIALVG